MGIKYFEEHKVFKLDGKNTSYIMAVIDEEEFWDMYILVRK